MHGPVQKPARVHDAPPFLSDDPVRRVDDVEEFIANRGLLESSGSLAASFRPIENRFS